MGKVLSMLGRPIRTFNIENRAEKIISRDKPIPAPQYSYTIKQKELVNTMHPDLMEMQRKKDIQLDNRLKEVYVQSIDPEKKDTKVSTKPLPEDKTSPPQFEFGFYETDIIPGGKYSLRQALTFLTRHVEQPTEYTAKKIALEYKLDEKVVESILTHFKIPKRLNPEKPAPKSTK